MRERRRTLIVLALGSVSLAGCTLGSAAPTAGNAIDTICGNRGRPLPFRFTGRLGRTLQLGRGKLWGSASAAAEHALRRSQVRYLSAGQRAVGFLAAGGDMVLTVDSALVATMTRAIRARMQTDPAFASKVTASVLRILRAKQSRELLTNG